MLCIVWSVGWQNDFLIDRTYRTNSNNYRFLKIPGNPDFASKVRLKQPILSKYHNGLLQHCPTHTKYHYEGISLHEFFCHPIFVLAFRRHAVRSQELSNSDIGCFALAKFEKWHYSIYDSVTKKCYLLDLDTENPPNTGPGSDIASNFIGKV